MKSYDGTRLHGWFFPAQEPRDEKDHAGSLFKDVKQPIKGTVVQFHGNGQNMTTHFMSYIWMIYEGYNLLCFDYRGYGLSDGKPDQPGVYLDSLAAMTWPIENKKELPLILVGQSLGGAILMRSFPDFKSRPLVKAVVIESSFYSYQALGSDILSRFFLTWPFQWLGHAWISDQFSPEDFIPQISPTPLLVIHGDQDPVIPLRFGEEIFRRAKEPKTFWKVEGGSHINEMVNSKLSRIYQPKLLNFLDQLK